VVKKTTEEVARQEAESALKEGGKYHNLICVGCCNVFPDGRMPLWHDTVWEEVVGNKLANVALVCNGRLE
jgi:hypothetical protein